LPRLDIRALAVTAAVLIILLLTLLPSGSGPSLPFSFQLGGERRWLADGILNLCLFVPFGVALGWNSRSTWMVILCGFLLSTAIELSQIFVPGRDPALSDIVFNTLGTIVGALVARRPQVWLFPDNRTSWILTSVATVFAGTVMTATVLLLSPQGSAVIARSGNDLLLQYPTRAGAVGLDEPEYWAHDAFQSGQNPDAAEPIAQRERNHWVLSIGSEKRVVVGPTVGQGWTLLAYPNAIGRKWGWLINGGWLFAVCLPIGFWARGRFRIVAVGLLVALMLLIPAITGSAPTAVDEWIGVFLGLVVGFLFLVVRKPG
jgi:hypothetical protein